MSEQETAGKAQGLAYEIPDFKGMRCDEQSISAILVWTEEYQGFDPI